MEEREKVQQFIKSAIAEKAFNGLGLYRYQQPLVYWNTWLKGGQN